MKLSLSILLLLTGFIAFAQPKAYNQAIINTTTNIIAPEEENVESIQQDPRGGMNFRNMMDGETKFVTYLRNDLVKTNMKSEMGKSTIFRDNSKKLTTIVMEMMGNKSGFFATDEDQAQMQKRRDSMMAERRKLDTDSTRRMPPPEKNNAPVEISLTTETKKIAGYDCKKAYLITSRFLGSKDTAVVWFTSEFKLNNVLSTGGMNSIPGIGNMFPTLNGLDKIDGFVMRYEMKMRRNRRMEVEVTKVDLTKEVEAKEFDLPKDIEIKPMSEMQNMFRGGGGGGFMRGRD
ncbi:MAG: hypothetical protein WCH52_06255 [Bacteroidota bacterium]